jgi:hypothetical protein
MKKVIKNPDVMDEKYSGIELSAGYDVVMEVVNKRRPYEPSDFVNESFTPNI